MPNRILKEAFLTSDKIAGLSDFEFRVWASLIVSVDDAGRGDARPAIVKGHCFPLRERVTSKDIDNAIHSLAAKGCISLYTVGGKSYFWFPTWSKHQRVRDVKPKFPSPDEADDLPDCGQSRQSAADCGGLRQIAADCRLNPNPIRIQSESNPTRNAAVGAVVSAYMDKIEPCPAQRTLSELSAWVDKMGKDCCLKAIDLAIQAGVGKWYYIRGILRRRDEMGVRTIEEWEKLDKQEEAKRRGTVTHTIAPPGKSSNVDSWEPRNYIDD